MHTEAAATLQGKPMYYRRGDKKEEWVATFLMVGLTLKDETFWATNQDGDEYIIGSTSWMAVDELNKFLLRKQI